VTLGLAGSRPLAQVEHRGEGYRLYVLPGMGGASGSDDDEAGQGTTAGTGAAGAASAANHVAPAAGGGNVAEPLGLFVLSLRGLLQLGGGGGRQQPGPLLRRAAPPPGASGGCLVRFVVLGQSPWVEAPAAEGADAGGGGGGEQPAARGLLSPMVSVTVAVRLEEDEEGSAAGFGDLLDTWLQQPCFCRTRGGGVHVITLGIGFLQQ
jgi:hypothetical protein